jgi:hypothetical protein
MTRPPSDTAPFPTRGYGRGGVYRRRRIWWMHYSRNGRVIRQSTGCTDRSDAEAILDTVVGIRGPHHRGEWRFGNRLATWRLTVDEMRALRGPVVYVLQCQGRTLYVGASARGLCRPLAAAHHVLGQFAFTGAEDLIVHACASPADALALEAKLIATLHPQLNRGGRGVLGRD